MKLVKLAMVAGLVAGFVFVGCDSGGSDGNADTTATEDTVSGEDLSVTPPGDVSTLQETMDDDMAAGCENECPSMGATQCVGANSVATCGPNADNCLVWSQPVACPENQVCNATTKQCAADAPCQDQCPTVGAKSCIDTATVGVCQLGGDGCNALVQSEVCQAPQTCANGACSGGGTGDGECTEIVECINGCGMNQQCAQTCYDNGTAGGQAAFDALQNCGMGACANFQDPAEQSLCILQNCKTEYEGCNGAFGTKGCMGILQCLQGCQNQQCQMDCVNSGSYDGMVTLMEVQVCLSKNCSNCGQNDSACIQQCAMSKCSAEVTACQMGG